MDEAVLPSYIPSYGDRIALFNFCRNHKSLSKTRFSWKVQGDRENENEKGKDTQYITFFDWCFYVTC